MEKSNAIVKRLVEGSSLKKIEFAHELGISSPAVVDWTRGKAKIPSQRIADIVEISDHPHRKELGMMLLYFKLAEMGFVDEIKRLLSIK